MYPDILVVVDKQLYNLPCDYNQLTLQYRYESFAYNQLILIKPLSSLKHKFIPFDNL